MTLSPKRQGDTIQGLSVMGGKAPFPPTTVRRGRRSFIKAERGEHHSLGFQEASLTMLSSSVIGDGRDVLVLHCDRTRESSRRRQFRGYASGGFHDGGVQPTSPNDPRSTCGSSYLFMQGLLESRGGRPRAAEKLSQSDGIIDSVRNPIQDVLESSWVRLVES